MRIVYTLSIISVLVAAVAFSCNSDSKKNSPGEINASDSTTLNPNMVWIPEGTFTMGTDNPNSMPNERPAHQVKINGFWMDRYAVTNAEFRKFIEATGYKTTAEKPIDWEELKKQLPPGTPKPSEVMLQPGSLVFTPPKHPVDLNNMSGWWTWMPGANWEHPQGPESAIEGKDNYPVVQVSWDDAVAYAGWAGKRLPSEAEWEYASRGGSENTRYYWGNDFLVDGKYMANTFTGTFPYENTARDGFEGLAPVGSFQANGYGLYDMAGNAWNWTADLYVENDHARLAAISCDQVSGEAPLPIKAATGEIRRVTKGGSFLCNPSYCESYRPTARRGTPYDTGMGHLGFRCVKNK